MQGSFLTVEQSKRVIANYMNHSGRGGFMTGTVLSIKPLEIRVEDRFNIKDRDIYITENCIGLIMHWKHLHKDDPEKLKNDVIVREPLKAGEGVLILCRPDRLDGVKYILLDRIQPYKEKREVDAR